MKDDGSTCPVRPKTRVLMQCPGNLAAVGEQTRRRRGRVWSQAAVRSTAAGRLSGRLATGRRHQLPTMRRARGWYSQSIGILLCTTACGACTTGTVRGHTVRIVTPNSCSLPHLTTGRALEHLQRRSTPDPTCAEPCLHWRWHAGRLAGWTMDIVCLYTPLPLPPAPRPSHLQIRPTPAFQSLSGSSSRPLDPGLSPCWPVGAGRTGSTTHAITARHNRAGQPGQPRAAHGKTDRDGTGEACGASSMQQDLHPPAAHARLA